MANILILLLVINFIADQLFQPKQVLRAKNDNTIWMILHVVIWCFPMLIFAWIITFKVGDLWPLKWFCSILPLHFIVEWPLNRYGISLLHKKKTTLAITVIHLEKLLLNIAILLTFLYFSNGSTL